MPQCRYNRIQDVRHDEVQEPQIVSYEYEECDCEISAKGEADDQNDDGHEKVATERFVDRLIHLEAEIHFCHVHSAYGACQ